MSSISPRIRFGEASQDLAVKAVDRVGKLDRLLILEGIENVVVGPVAGHGISTIDPLIRDQVCLANVSKLPALKFQCYLLRRRQGVSVI